LLDIAGETIVPPEVSDTLSLDAGLTAIVGTLSGREINANPDFDITLKEDIRYIVRLLLRRGPRCRHQHRSTTRWHRARNPHAVYSPGR
jgi:hypothetical protein